MSNLEPIDESDLNLKEKFVGGGIKEEGSGRLSEEKEKPVSVENKEGSEGEKTLENSAEKNERKEGVVEKDATYAKILQKAPPVATPIHDDVSADAKNASFERDAESKIENLVKIAELKGIPHAVKVARHLEDNYVLDEFHDRMLSQEFHDALVKKGMIKEI
jgi:hypothetical protein